MFHHTVSLVWSVIIAYELTPVEIDVTNVASGHASLHRVSAIVAGETRAPKIAHENQ